MQEVEDKTKKVADVIMLTDDLITLDKTQYKIVENHDGGFNEEKIEERYNNVLDKYDYIVGDWGYDQLRFKGFYEDERNESTLDNRISHLEDYLLEYCNFGCAYFVLEKVKKAPLKGHSKNSHKFHTRTTRSKVNSKASRTKNNNQHNHNNKRNKNKVTTAKQVKNHSSKKKPTNASTKRTFKIRKIGEKNK